MTMRRFALAVLGLSLSVPFLLAQEPSSVLGDWREPGGSVIHIARCGEDVCASLIKVSPAAGASLDVNNPDTAKRSTPLCGLQIGYGFHLTSPDHADDGHLYDPKSGKTYSGEMTAQGDQLELRGYVGIKAFGRSEEWTRVSATPASCS